MRAVLDRLWADEQAVTTVEYALLLVTVVVAGVVAWQNLGVTLGNMVQECSTQIANGP